MKLAVRFAYRADMIKLMLRLHVVAFALQIGSFSVFAEDRLPKPDRIPSPPSDEQAALIREGVALHDQRNFAGAIAQYKKVLTENPWEVNALHELAFTYFENKDFEAALDTARRGAQCKSQLLPAFHTIIGSALDELGKGSEAIETYRAAIRQNPRAAMLHYNLAISLRRAGKQSEAKTAAEDALHCDPSHRSSHAVLAAIYGDMGYRIPAILAYSRFLTLEPESARATQVLPMLLNLLTRGVGKGKGQNEINIFLSETPKTRQDEGDFLSVEMMMSVGLAADLITVPEQAKKEPKTGFQKLVSIYTGMGEGLNLFKSKRGFAASYYAPYLAALTKAGHTEAFVAHAWKAGNIDGASDWAKANPAKIEAFLAWSKDYQWPAK